MSTNKSKKIFPYVATLLLFLIALLVLLTGDTVTGVRDRFRSDETCIHEGPLEKRLHLDTYLVQSGDSIIEIARDIVGNPDRAGEIIILNQDRYPSLTQENPMLEPDWELVLPPKNTEHTNGLLYAIGGKIILGRNGWSMKWTGGTAGPFNDSDLPAGLSEQECVIAIYQGNNVWVPTPLKVVSVAKQ